MHTTEKKVWTAPKLDRVPMSSTAQVPDFDICDFFPELPECQGS